MKRAFKNLMKSSIRVNTRRERALGRFKIRPIKEGETEASYKAYIERKNVELKSLSKSN